MSKNTVSELFATALIAVRSTEFCEETTEYAPKMVALFTAQQFVALIMTVYTSLSGAGKSQEETFIYRRGTSTVGVVGGNEQGTWQDVQELHGVPQEWMNALHTALLENDEDELGLVAV
jgi:hypothetical protein